eukprot:2590121-Pyramimonas_sp.AAC.1
MPTPCGPAPPPSLSKIQTALCFHMWSMRGQTDAAPPHPSLSEKNHANYILGQSPGSCPWGPRALCIVFDRDGGGVSLFPVARRATVHDKTNKQYNMHLAAKSGPYAAILRSRSSGF